jgi:hypothetical protein
MGFDLTPTYRALPLSLAQLAAFRVVGESLFKEELLFSRREHEHHTTTDALDISVCKGHIQFLRTAGSEKGQPRPQSFRRLATYRTRRSLHPENM